MRKLILLWLCLFSSHFAISQELNFLDSLRLQFEHEAEKMRTEFEAYAAKATAEYEQYIKSIAKIWGTDSIVTDTRTEWVEYTPDKQSRSIVNFENGDIIVEIVIDPEKSRDSIHINERMAQAIEYMLNSRGSTCPYPSTVEKSEPLTHKPILDNIVNLSGYNMTHTETEVTSSARKTNTPPMPIVKGTTLKHTNKPKITNNAPVPPTKQSLASKMDSLRRIQKETVQKKLSSSVIAKNVAEQSKKILTPIKKVDGKPMQTVQVKMNLVTDNIPKNAALYKDLISEFSNKFQIEQPLIYAIMEQESSFNPRATSHANAIGLMQIVPNKAGIDAYRYVYRKDTTIGRSYLYNPRNNIELGTAYLRILSNQFRKVSDDMCRQLCIIASYNTGAGNVSTCFSGNTNLSKAIPHIDAMDYNRLFNHLVTSLPKDETRDYVKKVIRKREKYLRNNTL